MLKKLAVLLLLIVLLASCAQEQVELPDFLGNSNDFVVKYNGHILKLYQDYDEEEYVIVYKDENSPQSDALLNRIKEIENKYDLVIERTDKGSDDTIDYYIKAIAGDSCEAELLFRDNGKSTWFWADAGVCIPFTEFPDIIDLSDHDKYGSPGVLEAAMVDGKPITVQPGYWPGFQGVECFYLAYNKDKISSLGLTDLHEYYENETWTWDTMLELFDDAESILFEDDVLFTAHAGYLLNTVLYSNGFDFIDVIDGEPRFNLFSDDCINSLEFFKDLNSRYGDKVIINSSRWNIKKFAEGKSLTAMAIAQDFITGTLAYNTDFEYGLMPFPSGPDGEYGKWAQTVTRTSGFSIPITVDDSEMVARVVSEFCEPFEEFGGSKEGLIEYYCDSIFLDELDGLIYFAVEDGVRYDYDDVGLIDSLQGMAVALTSSSPMEVLQSQYNRIYDIYNNYIEPNLKLYIMENMEID
ncbi:MAG: extracellular solute-binding protein [Clostridia bacterium]|nr:extracellular solute-binding protein [Clostridia bacterium]